MNIIYKLTSKFKLPVYSCALLFIFLNICNGHVVPLDEIKRPSGIVVFKLSYCYNKESRQEKADIAKNKTVVLLRAIESSGSGMNREQAFKVGSVSDEYILAGKLGIKKSTEIRNVSPLCHG